MDLTEIIKSCIATLVIFVLGLVFLGMIAEALPGVSAFGKSSSSAASSSSPASSSHPQSIQLINENRPLPHQPPPRTSRIPVIALIAGVTGPLVLVYLIVRHLNRPDKTNNDILEMVSVAGKLQKNRKAVYLISKERRRLTGKRK